MNLSVKNMIFAFVTGLVVFSLIMTAICVGMFNSEVEVAKSGDIDKPESAEVISLDKAVAFKVENNENGGISFIVLAMVDNDNGKVLLTPIYGDYLIPYKNALSYVSNVYLEIGDEMLPEMIKAFSGIALGESDIFAVENIVNYDGLKAVVLAELADKIGGNQSYSSYEVKDFLLVLKENQTENTHERIKQIDTEKSVEKFRNILD